jgi:hypothetical protein
MKKSCNKKGLRVSYGGIAKIKLLKAMRREGRQTYFVRVQEVH